MPRSSERSGRAPEDVPPKLPPARTRERRVGQLVNLAEDLVEERLRKGEASPTEVTAIIRLGTAQELANIERIKAQTAYLEAQKAKAESEVVREEMFTRAMAAMSRYQGREA